jgi:hypothetical protein
MKSTYSDSLNMQTKPDSSPFNKGPRVRIHLQNFQVLSQPCGSDGQRDLFVRCREYWSCETRPHTIWSRGLKFEKYTLMIEQDGTNEI